MTFGGIGNRISKSIGSSASKFLHGTGLNTDQTARLKNMAGIAASVAGIAGAGVGIAKQLNPLSKFTVVYLSNGRVKHKTLTAGDGMSAIDKIRRKDPSMSKPRFFKKGIDDEQAQDYFEALQETKSYSKSELIGYLKDTYRKFIPKEVERALLVSFGMAVTASTIKAIRKGIIDYREERNKDRSLNEKNERLNTLIDNYRIKGLAKDKGTPEDYFNELSILMKLVLNHSKYNKNEKGKSDILATVIAPFVGLLRVVLVRDVHVLTGQDIGADRTDFELVFAPGILVSDELRQDPYRDTIFKHPWPSHGFKTTTMGAEAANKLIHNTFKFLSENPKFLAIRV